MIIPVVLLVILLVIMLLLRTVVAALVLVLTTALSFGASLGLASLLWRYGFGYPGVDPQIPLYIFIFLAALGVDYNIFLSARVREESRQAGTRQGVLRGLAVTGGVITAAGVILAATFAALAQLPSVSVTEVGTAIASASSSTPSSSAPSSCPPPSSASATASGGLAHAPLAPPRVTARGLTVEVNDRRVKLASVFNDR